MATLTAEKPTTDLSDVAESDKLLEEAIRMLPEIGRCLVASLMRHPSLHGSSVPQLKALGFLAHHAPCTVGELATGMGIAMATASEAVDRLVERSLIERRSVPSDRRRVMLALTKKGHILTEDLLAIRRRQVGTALARLPTDERATFVAGLRVLVEVLQDDALATPPGVGTTHPVDPAVR